MKPLICRGIRVPLVLVLCVCELIVVTYGNFNTDINHVEVLAVNVDDYSRLSFWKESEISNSSIPSFYYGNDFSLSISSISTSENGYSTYYNPSPQFSSSGESISGFYNSNHMLSLSGSGFASNQIFGSLYTSMSRIASSSSTLFDSWNGYSKSENIGASVSDDFSDSRRSFFISRPIGSSNEWAHSSYLIPLSPTVSRNVYTLILNSRFFDSESFSLPLSRFSRQFGSSKANSLSYSTSSIEGSNQLRSESYSQPMSRSFFQLQSESFSFLISQSFSMAMSQSFSMVMSQSFSMAMSQSFSQVCSESFSHRTSRSFSQVRSESFSLPVSESFSQVRSESFSLHVSESFSQVRSESFSHPPSQSFSLVRSESFSLPPSQSFSQLRSESFSHPPSRSFSLVISESFSVPPPPSQSFSQFRSQSMPRGSQSFSMPKESFSKVLSMSQMFSESFSLSQSFSVPQFSESISIPYSQLRSSSFSKLVSRSVPTEFSSSLPIESFSTSTPLHVSGSFGSFVSKSHPEYSYSALRSFSEFLPSGNSQQSFFSHSFADSVPSTIFSGSGYHSIASGKSRSFISEPRSFISESRSFISESLSTEYSQLQSESYSMYHSRSLSFSNPQSHKLSGHSTIESFNSNVHSLVSQVSAVSRFVSTVSAGEVSTVSVRDVSTVSGSAGLSQHSHDAFSLSAQKFSLMSSRSAFSLDNSKNLFSLSLICMSFAENSILGSSSIGGSSSSMSLFSLSLIALSGSLSMRQSSIDSSTYQSSSYPSSSALLPSIVVLSSSMFSGSMLSPSVFSFSTHDSFSFSFSLPSLQYLPTAAPTVLPTRHDYANETHLPTVTPTVAPTNGSEPGLPSIAPTILPSILPTLGVNDTMQPSVSPSFSPTVVPTTFHTFSPTVDDLPAWDNSTVYARYLDQLQDFKGRNVVVFSTLNYRGEYKLGSCINWNTYIDKRLELPLETMYYSKLQARYYSEDLRSMTSFSAFYTCSDKTLSKSFAAAMLSRKNYEMLCDGHSWKVFTCNEAPSFCVDCNTTLCDREQCGSTNSTMMIAPCASSCGSARNAYYYSLGLEFEIEKLYPLVISKVQVEAYRSSISVQVNISSSGLAYCAAVARNVTVSTPTQVKSIGSFTVAPSGGIYSILIKKVIPDTEYDIYCYTEDFFGHAMFLDDVLITKRQTKTLCCRRLSFSNFVAQNVAGEYSNPILVTLDSNPRKASNISITSDAYSCRFSMTGVTSSLSVTPSLFSFTPNSLTLSKSFVIRGTAGCYVITASMISGDNYVNVSRTVFVRSTSVPPDPPVLTTAQFSNDGRQILITFDSPTDYGVSVVPKAASTIFSCSNFLRFPGSSQLSCFWQSNKILVVMLSSAPAAAAGVNLGTNITLFRVLTASCPVGLTCSYSPVQNMTIRAPDDPISPVVRLSSASLIASCDDIVIDTSASTGQASRDWKSISWTVTSPDLPESNQTAVASRLAAKYSSSIRGLVVIENMYLRPGTYVITMIVENFLGTTGRSSISIVVSTSSGVHKVSMAGSISVSVYRWQSNSFFAIASSKGCSGDSVALDYSWAIYENYQYTEAYPKLSKDKRAFKFQSYSLNTVSSYILKVSVTAEGTTTTATVAISLLSSGVIAMVKGGSQRTIGIDELLTLDAGSSYDIDYPTDSLIYSWSCITKLPSYGDACNVDSTTSSQTFLVPATSLMENYMTLSSASFVMTVHVMNNNQLSDSTDVTVTVKSVALPIISLSMGNSLKFGVSSNVVISGSITGSGAFAAQWDSETIALVSPLTLTPVSKYFSNAGSFGFSLVISGGSLAYGLSLTFQLLASYDDITNVDKTSVGLVTITMNSPPLGGSISVQPGSGTALQTSFDVSTFSWSDDAEDFPLSYVLSYNVIGTTSSLVIKNSDCLPYVFALLGQGLQTYGYNVTVTASAYDIYGDYSSTSAIATVLPQVNLTAIRIAANLALKTAFMDGNPSSVSQAVAAAANSMNCVNCTIRKPCEKLNRMPCSTTSNTCGDCLTGFVGAAGHSNTACTKKHARRLLSGCEDDTDCLAGTCMSGVCVATIKECPNNCSMNGVCGYYDVDSLPIDVCHESNSFCRASCNCSTGFFGNDCSITAVEVTSRQEMREKLCVSLYDTLELQDISSDAILSRANLISGLLLDLSQLTETAYEMCASVLVSTVETDPVLVAKSATAQLCADAFSSVLARGSSIPADLFKNVSYALNLLSSGIQSNMVAGQDTNEITTSTFRLSNALVYSTDLASTPLAAAQTELESMMDQPKTTFQLSPNATVSSSSSSSSSGMGSLSVSVLQYSNNPHGAGVSNAVSTGLQVSQDDSTTEDALLDSIITLQNVRPVEYYFYPEFWNLTLCLRTLTPYNKTVLCNHGTNYTVHCSGEKKYYLNYTCPEVSLQPQCITWDNTASDYAVNPYCDVISHTPYNTTCSCRLELPSGASRRKLGGSGFPATGMTEFSASADTIVSNFGKTLEVAATLTPASIIRNIVIFSLMTGIVVALLVGLCFTIRKDLQEIDLGIAACKKDMDSVVSVTADYTFDAFMETVTPIELTKTPAAKKLVQTIVSYHDYIYSFSKFDEQGDFRTVAWLNAMGWTLMFLFMDTVLAALFFFDDGSCETHLTRGACLLQTSLDQIDTLCLWDDVDQTCSFNQDIGNSALSNLILTGLITVFSIPFEKLFEILVEYVREYAVVKYLKNRKPRWRSPVDQLCLDLCSYESKRNTFLRAARLELMKQNIDEVSTHTEAISLTAESYEISEYYIVPEHKKDVVKDWDILHSLTARKQLSHHYTVEDRSNVKVIEKRIELARKSAEEIVGKLEECETDFEREVILIRQFQASLLSSFRQFISKRFYDKGYAKEEALKVTKIGTAHYIALFFLPCYVFFTCFFVFLFGVRMGPATTAVWLKGAAISWVLEMLMLKPVKILMRSIVLSQVVYPDVRAIHDQLISRAKLVMARTKGLISSHGARIQHFNAACRAARKFPHLQVSRLLMSLNDHDFPSLLTASSTGYTASFVALLQRYTELLFLGFLLLLTSVPGDVQDILIDFIGTVFSGGAIVLLALSSQVHIAIPIVIGILIFFFFASSYFYLLRKNKLANALINASHDMLHKRVDFSFNKKQKKWRSYMGHLGSPTRKRANIKVLPIDTEGAGVGGGPKSSTKSQKAPNSPGMDLLDTALSTKSAKQKRSPRSGGLAIKSVFNFASQQQLLGKSSVASPPPGKETKANMSSRPSSSSSRADGNSISRPSSSGNGLSSKGRPSTAGDKNNSNSVVSKLLSPSFDILGSNVAAPVKSKPATPDTNSRSLFSFAGPQVHAKVDAFSALNPSSVDSSGKDPMSMGAIGDSFVADNSASSSNPIASVIASSVDRIFNRNVSSSTAAVGGASSGLSSAGGKRALRDYAIGDVNNLQEESITLAGARAASVKDSPLQPQPTAEDDGLTLSITTKLPSKKRLDWSNIGSFGAASSKPGTPGSNLYMPSPSDIAGEDHGLSLFDSNNNNSNDSQRNTNTLLQHLPSLPAPVVTWQLPGEEDDNHSAGNDSNNSYSNGVGENHLRIELPLPQSNAVPKSGSNMMGLDEK